MVTPISYLPAASTPPAPLPTAPAGTTIYSAGPGQVTLTYVNGAVTTLQLPNIIHASTSYYDAAQASSYSQAMQSWSSQQHSPTAPSAATATTVQQTQPSATQQSSAYTLLPTPTTTPHQGGVAQAAEDMHVGAIFGIVASILLAGVTGVLLWLWCRKRRCASVGVGKTYARHDTYGSEEERAERSMTQAFASSNEFRVQRRCDTPIPPKAARITTHAWSPPPVLTLQIEPFIERSHGYLLDTIFEATHETEIVSPTSVLSVGTFGARQRGVERGVSVLGTQDSALLAADGSNISIRSAQGPVRSEGPFPLRPRSSGGASIVAEMARSRAVMTPPDPIVDESFDGPKEQGMIGEAGETSYDWRRCSFGADVERAMWITSMSECSVASQTASEATSFDSQHATSHYDAATAAKRTIWQARLHNLNTLDHQEANWLSTPRDAAASRSSTHLTITVDEHTFGTDAESWRSRSNTPNSSHFSMHSSYDTLRMAELATPTEATFKHQQLPAYTPPGADQAKAATSSMPR